MIFDYFELSTRSSLLSTTNNYLACCLQGVEFPSKSPLDQPDEVRKRVFTLLLTEYVSSQQNFPLLRILVKSVGSKLFKSLDNSIKYLRQRTRVFFIHLPEYSPLLDF